MKPATNRLYERVANSIAAKIASGEHSLGDRLPSERDLALAHGVSRPTIREAIIALELDGLVEVRMGSGVFVVARQPKGGASGVTDVGPFELLEARRSIEAEACALAAVRISDTQLAELADLLDIINSGRDLDTREEADHQFHIKIAESSGNSAMEAVVEMLWDARTRSPQYRLLTHKAHEAGVGPDIDEHAMILEALKQRDPIAAANAMRMHLNRVMEGLLEATEVHELEQVRERVNAQRKKFTRPERL